MRRLLFKITVSQYKSFIWKKNTIQIQTDSKCATLWKKKSSTLIILGHSWVIYVNSGIYMNFCILSYEIKTTSFKLTHEKNFQWKEITVLVSKNKLISTFWYTEKWYKEFNKGDIILHRERKQWLFWLYQRVSLFTY